MDKLSSLVSARAAQRQLSSLRVVDCSHDLGNPEAGAQQYGEGHVPGAVHAHLDLNLSGTKTGANGRHPLPRVGDLARWLGAQGIAQGDPVLAYDRSGGGYAARLWWLLKWLGHDQVGVLDGGWQAWVAEGGAVSTEPPRYAAVDYGTPAQNDSLWVDVAFVQRNLDTRAATVVDARGAERFAGTVEPLDARAGHIPGAVNRPYTDNLAPDGRFKSPDVLAADWRRVLGAATAGQVVSQCGSGVTACHNLLALDVAGLGMARLYPGSWSEWCADAARPMASGKS